MSKQKRPPFKSVKPIASYSSPEELFYRLSDRAKTHGYLRGPQQDVLRDYISACPGAPGVAFELPTGTGKTAVGLLIGEWKRLQGQKVAYLALTNQLAGQVLAEAARLGVQFADLRGTKDTRSVSEEGRYKTGSAIAVTTYSNLFNINPVIQEPDLIVFDDAHGGEQYVADMWTVTVSAAKDPSLYESLLAALRPGLSESQIRTILDKSGTLIVELADVPGHRECIANVTTILDEATADSLRFAWKLIRNKLPSCLVLLSAYEITIRPLVPPTHMHPPFAGAKQRIYMSATLGGESDLQRAYGIEKLQMVRAKSSQWGRRYVFVPGLYVEDGTAQQIVGNVWDGMRTRRAVLLSPSERVMSRTFNDLSEQMTNKPVQMTASDIANTLDGFTGTTDAILTLAGRYDGLDLPDEQCRLLILSESPAAINPLERHLSDRWKMGPVLRRRMRTRLIQGMGRCTRNATDFAIIIWLGQSLVNAATSTPLLNGMPPELAAEVAWGKHQSEIAARSPDQLVSMILGLIEDAAYRNAANGEIGGTHLGEEMARSSEYEEAGRNEVWFARSMWDENYPRAYEIARALVDQLNSPELSGYRAWWCYLASVAACLMNDANAEQDCLRRGSKCGVNSGWLNRLLQDRTKSISFEISRELEPNAEGVWDVITNWGWAGPTFEKNLGVMLNHLRNPRDPNCCEGLELLGKCFGAKPTRITEQGAPDVVWSFPTDFHIAFEVKSEKEAHAKLSKKDVQEAKGHIDWVKARLCQNPASASITAVVVAPSPDLHEVALPFAGELLYISPEEALALADQIVEKLRSLRLKFSGREYTEAAAEFSAEMRNGGLVLDSLKKIFLARPLLSKK